MLLYGEKSEVKLAKHSRNQLQKMKFSLKVHMRSILIVGIYYYSNYWMYGFIRSSVFALSGWFFNSSPWLQLYLGDRSAFFDCHKVHTQATSRITPERDSFGVGNWRSLMVGCFMWYCSENWHIRLQWELAFYSAGKKTLPVTNSVITHKLHILKVLHYTHKHTDCWPDN